MALASTQVRIRNKEGIPLTKNGTYLTHIEMDNIGVSDLARSYLDLHMLFTDDAQETIKGANVYMGDYNTATPYDGQCLIRNARLTCEQFGILEENIKINVYHQTMRRYTQSRQEWESSEVYGNGRCITDPDTGIAHILVPLSSFLGCGTQLYDHQRLGASTIRLELEFQSDLFFIDAAETLGLFVIDCADVPNDTAAAIDVITLTTADSFADEETAFEYFSAGRTYQITGTNGEDEVDVERTVETVVWNAVNRTLSITFDQDVVTVAAGEEFTDIQITDNNGIACADFEADAGDSTSELTVPDQLVANFVVNTAYACGWYVGTVGANNVDSWYWSSALLNSAVQNGDDVVLTFATPIISFPSAPAGEWTAEHVFLVDKQLNPVDWTCEQIDLVLHKLLKPPSGMGKMSYETYSLEQTNQPETSSYRKQFYTEPNAFKFAYLTPAPTFNEDDVANPCLVSQQNGAEQFRITLNNIDLTNRDIPIEPFTNGSLYNDRLVMNVDGLKSVQPQPQGELISVIYTDRCPMGAQNMVEIKIDSDPNAPMTQVVGHFFKTLMREV
jgi:hypothetical protein